MKRKLTLGLLVFFVGVLITACGSKKSSTSNVTNNPTEIIGPISADDTCRAQGFCQKIGDYQITDQTQYGQVFPGYNTGTGNTIQSPYDDQGWNWNGFFDSFKETASRCAVQTGWAYIVARLGGEASATCEYQISDTRNDIPTGGLPINYPTTLNYEYASSTLSRVNLAIHDGTNGGNGRIIEFTPANNTSYPEQILWGRHNNQDIRLEWNGAGYDMDIMSGQIGRLNNLR